MSLAILKMASRWENLAQELATAFQLDDDQFEAVKGRRTGREGPELVSSFPPFSPALLDTAHLARRDQS